jgi:hypothetical protein
MGGFLIVAGALSAAAGASVGTGASAGTGTLQDERPRQQVDAVAACVDIADGQARLACFDRTVGEMRQGLQTGIVTVSRYPRVILPVRANVAAATLSGSGQWQIDLDNEQVWRSEESHPTIRVPAAGTPIIIEGGVFGGYWMRLPNGNRYKVRRVP